MGLAPRVASSDSATAGLNEAIPLGLRAGLSRFRASYGLVMVRRMVQDCSKIIGCIRELLVRVVLRFI